MACRIVHTILPRPPLNRQVGLFVLRQVALLAASTGAESGLNHELQVGE